MKKPIQKTNQTRGQAPLAGIKEVAKKVLPDNDSVKTVIIIVGGVLLIVSIKSILSSFGLIKTKEQLEIEKQDKNVSASSLAQLRTKYTPSLDNEQLYSNAANVIYNALGRYSAIDDDEGMAISTIKTYIRNPLDFALVQFYYGLRQNFNFGIPTGSPMALVTLFSDQFSKSHFAEVKTYLNSIGVVI
jgi:hypothetical protein